MFRKLQLVLLLACSTVSAGFILSCGPTVSLTGSLVPSTPGDVPNYFCTWNTQGYIESYKHDDLQRSAINEANIFGKGKYQDWISLYPQIRSDLYFVLDDSWDIPQQVNERDNKYLGTVELDTSRFPSYTGSPAQRLKKLSDAVKNRGWKGLGLWICAQEAPAEQVIDQEKYWVERLKASDSADVGYWKVDWGKQQKNEAWRKMITNLARKHAPRLTVEHAIDKSFIRFSDVYRTYDVENVIAQPVTVDRVVELLTSSTVSDARGLINCEDEPYIAAALGCVIGTTRHAFTGDLPNGDQDFTFPPGARDMKRRIDEMVRAVKWNRIAAPFGIGTTSFNIDSVRLSEFWVLEERESWNPSRKVGDTMKSTPPARVSRGMPLPHVTHKQDNPPIVLACQYPNNAVAIATIGRTLGRKRILNRETITLDVPKVAQYIGVFGDYEELIIVFPPDYNFSGKKIVGQDLAGEVPVDLTHKIKMQQNKLIISGEIIRNIGGMSATPQDISEAGMVIKITGE